ncbi:hypothetical protein [Actinacidiphila yeochonensis]|uniref:hypothetical protein n=1 Tax=Actinacidiphila yeochonensis TaxID=89050 RepID=UPI0006900F1A|nr:hypothetical protein [Actinacidiphila yeochonensis]
MKYSKVAAVLAGSVMAAGMAVPAFAETAANSVSPDNMSTMPTSINGGVDQALAEQPLQKVADTTHVQDALETVQGGADQVQGVAGSALNSVGGLQGVQNTAGSALGGLPGGSLLGGLPLGSLLGGLG